MSALRRMRLQGVLNKTMTRESGDEIRYGRVWNGFDYALQVWVVDGIIQDCGHPAEMQVQECCNAHKLAGKRILEVPGAQKRRK